MPDDRLPLDPDLLCGDDLRRASRDASVRETLQQRGLTHPIDLLGDPIDKLTLTIWGFLTRTDPSVTWDQADHISYGTFAPAGSDPPQTAGPEGNGERPGNASKPGSAGKRNAPATAPSSAPSST